MAKRRKAARRRVARKAARKRRRSSPDSTINTLVILVVIVIVLGGLFLYAKNNKQAALWPNLMQTVAALIAPAPTASTPPPDIQPAPALLPSVAEPAAPIAPPPETTGSVQFSQPAAIIQPPPVAIAKPRQPKTTQAAPATQTHQPAAIAVVPTQDH